ncbi:DUF4352 domain-containing protein [Streptomyces sp. NBC_00091]|uniref:DUF4352 domain-containing protein n=1 Tax=Streptomyces sp. NBC_00091 TaxID=2975648 RepID=UPI002254BE90|nr:DUF4352 domain-containing protein [Streptomyces sp. NBC_00091]MCX5380718.1 DUF4352 domain-containing protein [Streptomyces sp. NBC_00091]
MRRRPSRLVGPVLALLLIGAGPGGSGETVSLDGDRPGERLDVTLTRVVDPAGTADADRLVAVELRLENTGTLPYRDSPAPAAHLLDTEGQRFTGLNTTTDAGPSLPDTVTLAPGDSASGFVTFRLPKDAGLAAVQFALDGGLGDDVGHWSLS